MKIGNHYQWCFFQMILMIRKGTGDEYKLKPLRTLSLRLDRLVSERWRLAVGVYNDNL